MIKKYWSTTRKMAARIALGAAVALGAVALGAVAVAPAAWADHHEAGEAEAEAVRKFTVVNVLYEGSKIFVPSVLIVEKGEKVQIKVINKIPGDPPNHGFAIPAFGVEEVVNSGESKTVEFTADKAGLFEVKCQLHPAHVHAQLLVRGGGKKK